ncbi:hypothetical protein DV702_13070 [Sporosarcina sp. PTS2304]|uniref:hypothetical protein n=1 Tax=Sporosarcina sp. PTS2304 TaxID=2283194 RepID=UPI000E0DAAD9|nr:hypothetical protein [Sporosarcina sp. PTS2304]AXI00571.1 hypothetical protein DV702_13070 [Sporosarcina sp. PTS2304]
MKNLLKTFILGLIVMLVLNITSPAFANQAAYLPLKPLDDLSSVEKQTITTHLEEFKLDTTKNSEKLSHANKQIAMKSLKNIDKNLIYADIVNGEKNIILGTDNKDIFVAITDEIIDVVERVGEFDFLINGELNHFEVTISDDPVGEQKLSGYEYSVMAAPWIYKSEKTINVNAQRNFATYTAAVLGGILGTYLGPALGFAAYGVIATSLGVGAAYTYIAASDYPTNVGQSVVKTYRDGNYPTSRYRFISRHYAVYKGARYYLDTTTTYHSPCTGCGV